MDGQTFVHVNWLRVAPVQLDVVYLPVCKCLRVRLEVAQDAGVASTSVIAVVLVNTELQTSTVHLSNIQQLILKHSAR